ncbi:MAG: TetR/AcrR family transcriptional regulator [Melioribacteraceae bacterium]|nr:TetR/AcrR family transcriptional regulator [Melioribacteraceae bacterium]
MRIKDTHKQDAIISATVELVNEIGFVSSSVAKIAKKANVSPATLYVYYTNKEDLLVSTYIEIKKKMSDELLKNIDNTKPFRDILKDFWNNTFDFVSKNKGLFQYAEQFSNSPYSDLVNQSELEKHFEPMMRILQKGIDQKIIKDVPFEILTVFIFYPVMLLSNSKVCKKLTMDNETVETAFNLAWDAIKL